MGRGSSAGVFARLGCSGGVGLRRRGSSRDINWVFAAIVGVGVLGVSLECKVKEMEIEMEIERLKGFGREKGENERLSWRELFNKLFYYFNKFLFTKFILIHFFLLNLF